MPSSSRSAVPALRVRAANAAPVRGDGAHVVYWMTAFRRTRHNFALQHAVRRARELGRPLLVLEALRAGYPWASDRFHRFAIDAMPENAARLRAAGVAHHAYVEPAPGAGRGLLAALAADACVVVTDDYPEFFHPRMIAAAAARLPVRLEAVDSNGLLPLRAADRAFTAAYHFRRFLQKTLPDHLADAPLEDPLAAGGFPAHPGVPAAVAARWPAASAALLRGDPAALAALPIDHGVPPVEGATGGAEAGTRRLHDFLDRRLHRYADHRNEVEDGAASGLSPWLHWGFTSTHEILAAVAEREGWTPDRVALGKATGQRAGWWGLPPAAESFLDELVTWRELTFNTAASVPGHDRYETLPDWARATLEAHREDPRPALYPLEALEAGRTGDPLWNAAQGQLRRDGVIHNYLRMVWGKRVLEWTPDPARSIEWLLHLNNRWALDGRDPNSVGGVMWCFGRYDRPWGPERAVFGTVRYMSSENTARKIDVKGYLRRYAPAPDDAQIALL